MIGASIPFLSLTPGEDAADVAAAIERVVARGWFILGPEVEAFEAEFARVCGTAHAVGVGSGTDAIALTLRAAGVGPGDEVITSPLSAAFSALAIMMTGARPVFADVDPLRLTIDPKEIEPAITPRTRAILPVHLYGQPADMPAIERIASKHGVAVIEDCCQAHLATANGRPVGTFGLAGAFSFYPTKNLGALGDGGAVVTNDSALADRLRRLRNGGQSAHYRHDAFGINSRLDELQAAVLRARLAYLPRWTARRRQIAARYRRALSDCRSGARVLPEFDAGHVYHLFVIRTANRASFQTALAARGVQTLIHYPLPIPRQRALANESVAACPEADRACAEVLSLPLHHALTDAAADVVAQAVKEGLCVP
ncbi:MAG TPA: DegT/DnrJ/EryC1/StrS family aminotransferase [Vicinamibacterales bacterium]|nr:DegT/DnrJ/EryC1/StrS family aminotransferase [Vicinamibacterales bacterium]